MFFVHWIFSELLFRCLVNYHFFIKKIKIFLSSLFKYPNLDDCFRNETVSFLNSWNTLATFGPKPDIKTIRPSDC